MPPAADPAADPAAAEKGKRPAPPAMVVPVRSNRGNITIPIRGDNGSEDLLLYAGPNMVPAEKWAAAKKQPGVQRLLAEVIKPMKAPEFVLDARLAQTVGKTVIEEGKAVPAAAPLSGMDETGAIELVKDIGDTTVLSGLLTTESRAPVRRAITSRIEELRDPAKHASATEAAAGMGRAQVTLG